MSPAAYIVRGGLVAVAVFGRPSIGKSKGILEAAAESHIQYWA